MEVVIIGSGNVAHVLGQKILNAGHKIIEVVGRNREMVRRLSDNLQAQPCYHVGQLTGLADIYLLAVSDKSLHEIADNIRLHDKVVAHTAGAQPMNLLHYCSDHYGVIYPLQTLHKDAINIPDIPLLINGESDGTIALLNKFCATWSSQVSVLSDKARLKMHLAAVFSNNFVNHLLALTAKYCAENHLDFGLLKPLINETVARLQHNEPANVQTGPAIRRDAISIEQHLALLENYPSIIEIYKLLTKSIQDFSVK